MHLVFDSLGRSSDPRVALSPRTRTLVVGLGNPHRGDDGVGLAVLSELQSRGVSEDTTLLDGGMAGLDLVLEFMGRSRVLVIDAARFGGTAGETRRFDLLETELPGIRWNVGHAHGLAAAVELARALRVLPQQLVLYAVEPSELDVQAYTEDATEHAPRLSAPVARAVPAVLSEVLAELERPTPPKAQTSDCHDAQGALARKLGRNCRD